MSAARRICFMIVSFSAVLVSSIGPAGRQTAPDDAPIDFTRQIRPILSAHCFACHGPDEQARKAGLLLTDYESATVERAAGVRAVTPGDPEQSELWHRITSSDDPMPPRTAHNPLSPEEIELLRKWIEQGASYAPHWAYIPPRATPRPRVTESEWPATEVDHYILARLEEEGLSYAPDADHITLIRRLSYDLTGLPPRTSEIDAFLQDQAPDAYEAVVDRLLGSPHFGERMAMYWLDLVRYADTVGYHGDQPHRIWPYRDYIITAFNENKPFDEFTIEQIAGDLMPDPEQSVLVATGYNRLLQTSHEGGVQLKEYRAIYQADRIRNISGAWMGATMGCAQCHDHKYDPYTMRDFYAMGAFFADVDDEEHLRDPYAGLNTTPTARLPEMRVWSNDALRRDEDLLSRISALQRKMDDATARLPKKQSQWERALLAQVDSGVMRDTVWVDDVLDTGGATQGDWTFTHDDEIPPQSGMLYRRQSSEGLTQHYSVETTKKRIEIAAGDVFYCWVYLDPDDPPQAVMLQFNAGGGDWQHRAVWGGDDISYGRRAEDWHGYRRMGDLPPLGEWVRLEVPVELVALNSGQRVSGIAFTQFDGTVYWDRSGVLSDRVAPEEVIAALRTAEADRTDAQRATLHQHHIQCAPELIEFRARIAAMEQDRRALAESLPLTMFTRALDQPREVRIFPRGNWLDETGDVVEPAIPAFLGTLDIEGRGTRLDLARWLITPESEGGVGGLTARVFVNRMWALLFGGGLCPSLDDFGGQGRPPNHLELLDRLAIDFVESGWDVKGLIKKLVMTRTYRQSSSPHQEAAERDPENHLFARQARMRLPAEMVRDTALAVSDLLVRDIGGPSVKPRQPAGMYRHLNFPTRTYDRDEGPQQYRRGVYMHWQRQFLHPMLSAFDAPTREECTAQRPVSNTPLAALTLLNDPVFVEAARGFAERVLLEGPGDDRGRIAFAMREATGRTADQKESAVLESLLNDSLSYYRIHQDEAHLLISIGDSARDPSIDAPTLAAWTQICRAVLNLHETITRN